MLHAPDFKDLKDNILKTGNPLCCILFAPLFDVRSSSEIIPRLGYLDERTSTRIHFYCVGYGGYWPKSEYPDMRELEASTYKDGTKIPWAFSQKCFAKFVNDMETNTKWKYSGGTELIILNSHADLSRAIIFRIDEMLRDSVINNSYELFEALIQTAKKREPAIENFSLSGISKQSADALVETIKKSLPKYLELATNIWTRGKHYSLDNISK